MVESWSVDGLNPSIRVRVEDGHEVGKFQKKGKESLQFDAN